MKSINIAKFKAELGKYLGFVRQGEEVIVLDRTTPLARVVPFQATKAKLVFENPLNDPKNLAKLHYAPVPGLPTDSLKCLLEERGD